MTLRFGRRIGCGWVVAFAEKRLLSEGLFYGDLRIAIDEMSISVSISLLF